jgi:hypothetical protein
MRRASRHLSASLGLEAKAEHLFETVVDGLDHWTDLALVDQRPASRAEHLEITRRFRVLTRVYDPSDPRRAGQDRDVGRRSHRRPDARGCCQGVGGTPKPNHFIRAVKSSSILFAAFTALMLSADIICSVMNLRVLSRFSESCSALGVKSARSQASSCVLHSPLASRASARCTRAETR